MYSIKLLSCIPAGKRSTALFFHTSVLVVRFTMAHERFMIFTGTANPRLAVDVANHLDMPLGKMTVGRFSDGEVMVEINENVRGRDIFVLQPTCAPTNDNLME